MGSHILVETSRDPECPKVRWKDLFFCVLFQWNFIVFYSLGFLQRNLECVLGSSCRNMLGHRWHSSGRTDFMPSFLPVGGSSEHHREQGHPAEGFCVQELQPAPRPTLSLPGGLPASALAGHSGHVSSPWLFPGVHSGKWSPPGKKHLPPAIKWWLICIKIHVKPYFNCLNTPHSACTCMSVSQIAVLVCHCDEWLPVGILGLYILCNQCWQQRLWRILRILMRKILHTASESVELQFPPVILLFFFFFLSQSVTFWQEIGVGGAAARHINPSSLKAMH